MGCGPSKSERPKRDKSFKHNGPRAAVKKDSQKVVLEGPSGRLFFFEDEQGSWYYYNDSVELIMEVESAFQEGSVIEALGKTTCEPKDGGFLCKLTIEPGKTEPFIKGTPTGFANTYSGNPLTAEYKKEQQKKVDELVQQDIASLKQLAAGNEDQEELLKRCIEKGIMFVDLQFPPTASSLKRSTDAEAVEDCYWQRPSQYLMPEWRDHVRIFNTVEPNDIDQGRLGDCYYLCSMASLAEFPDKVRDAFRHPVSESKLAAEHKVGAYRVAINKNGWWNIMLLDDYVPVLGGQPFFAKNREDPAELWVQLLEKAYAKAHGSYSSIIGGDPLQALQDLTGYPVQNFDHEWEDAKKGDESLFKKLCNWDSEKDLITLNTPGHDTAEYAGGGGQNESGEEKKYEKAGLALGHAYSLLQAVFVEKHEFKLVKIRNPWGNATEWTGMWNDNDERWTKYPDVAKTCNFQKAADGTFWMDWDDVLKYFSGGGVCFTRFGWSDYRIKNHASKKMPKFVLEVKCTKESDAFIGLHQKDSRGLAEDNPEAKYEAFLLSIFRKPESGKEHEMEMHKNAFKKTDDPHDDPTFLSSRDISMRYKFEPKHSPYIIVPRTYDDIEKEFVISLIAKVAIGSGLEVSFRELPVDSGVYRNLKKFDYDAEKAPAVQSEFQYNPEVGVPVTLNGDKLKTKS